MDFLLDENLPPFYRDELLRREPALAVRMVGDSEAPPRGELDPDILRWCESTGFVLVTNNRGSMPGHLRTHLASDGHVPGIIVLRRGFPLGEVIDALLLVAGASLPGELDDRILFVPPDR